MCIAEFFYTGEHEFRFDSLSGRWLSLGLFVAGRVVDISESYSCCTVVCN